VHAHVIRPYSHSLSDDERLYKTPPSARPKQERDPVVRFPKLLLEEGVLDRMRCGASRTRSIEKCTMPRTRRCSPIRPARESALRHSIPTKSIQPLKLSARPPNFSGEPKTMVDLLNATLHEEMRRDPRVVVFGEDVADCSREAESEPW
jgi:2-oxoisovalerate dehydrogenase E1 component